MIKGQYVIYENGKEILRSPNIITKFGKRYFTRQIAGMIQNNSKDMAIGISDSKSISGVSGDGTSVTFTTTSAHGLTVGNKVSIVNVDPISYNLSDVVVDTIPTPNTFTVLSTAS
jgi:hypothetical protein